MRKCYCGSVDFDSLETKDYLYSGKRIFTYNICKFCRSYYLNENENFPNNYNTNYYSLQTKREVKPNILRALRFSSDSLFSDFLRFFKPLSIYDRYISKFLQNNKVTILDFGSGTSSYIKFLRAVGLTKTNSYSYDPYSKDNDTLTNFENIPFQEIDLIISNQVLEHLESPEQVIDKLFFCCKEECDFIFSVPVSGYILNNYQQFSYTLQAPDHLSILSIHAWIKLISNSQWKLISIVEDSQSKQGYIKKSELFLRQSNMKLKDFNTRTSLDQVDNVIFHLKKVAHY
jgi:hypothetical protein